MSENNESDVMKSSTEGHALSEGAYLDEHFQACQPEYEAMLQSVGLKRGWHVLDAGCGSGSFLPLMSNLLGSTGKIDALDIAPENVAIVESSNAQHEFVCPVTARVGSIANLPFKDNTFDEVWCAAISQYLTDEKLKTTLNEFLRVLKPGGLLAVKDFSLMCMQWQPLDPLLLSRFMQAQVDAEDEYTSQSLRNASLPIWVRHADFSNVAAQTTMVERMQPLRDVERAYLGNLMGYIASLALGNKALSKSDHFIWGQLVDRNSPDHILFHPDCYYSEAHIVVTANKPVR